MEEVLLFITPVLVGFGLLLLSRWARTRNKALAASGGDSKHDAFLKAARAKQYRVAARLFFFGEISSIEARIGQALALAVIILLGAALLLLFVLLAKS